MKSQLKLRRSLGSCSIVDVGPSAPATAITALLCVIYIAIPDADIQHVIALNGRGSHADWLEYKVKS